MRPWFRLPKSTRFFTLFLLAALLFGGLLTGCADGVFTAEDPTLQTRQSSDDSYDGPKFRNAHLMDRVLGQSAAKGASNDELGLIMEITPGLEPYKVLDRYKVLNRYKTIERYEYEHVFNGLAFDVLDSLGTFDAFLQLLDDDPDILWFEVNIDLGELMPHGNGANPSTPWGLNAIGADQLKDRKAKDVQIYVIDSGVSSGQVKVKKHFDFVDDNGDGEDYDGHGTHVAGIIGAKEKDGAEGVVQDGQIYNLKVMRDDGTTEVATVIAAVEHVIGEKLSNPAVPMVVNMSLGTDVATEENISLDQAIEAAIEAGVVFVISAGNAGIDAAHVSPAHVEGAITVGAYDMSKSFAWFSNYGPTVDILAPGVDIRSLNTEESSNGDKTVLMTGTSMATGFVTGAAVLFLQKYPQATAAQVEKALLAASRSGIAGAPSGTTSRSVDLANLSEKQLPPFFQHALLSGDDIEIKQKLEVKYDYDGDEDDDKKKKKNFNANVFANGSLDLKVDGVQVEGFGYAGHQVKPKSKAAQAFKPQFNPTGLPGYQSGVEEIDLPDFKAQDYAHLATQTFNKLELSGHYELGSYDAPEVWYVNGSVKTKGAVTFSGYGILLVKGNVEIKHSLTTEGSKDENRLGIYTSGSLKIKKDTELDMVGQLYVNKEVTFEGGFTLTGSVTARGKITFKSNSTGKIYFRLADPVLTDLIWPMEDPMARMLQSGQGASRGQKLMTRF